MKSTGNSNLSAVEDELAVVLIVGSDMVFDANRCIAEAFDQLMEDLILRLDELFANVEVVLTELFEHSIEDKSHVVVDDVIKRSRAQ